MTKISQSKRKLLNYLDNYIDSDNFQDEVKDLREKFKIPQEGYELAEEQRKKLILEGTCGDGDICGAFYLPKKWGVKKTSIIRDLNLSLRALTEKFPLVDMDIMLVFKIYLFHNIKLYKLLEGGLDEVDLCRIADIKGDLEEFEFLAPSKEVVDIFKRTYSSYPIVIKLHPAVTQRDLVDYIRSNWPKIDFFLSQYRDEESKLGKIKTRNISKKTRNDFIYENRQLPRRQIKEMVEATFGEELDYEYIGKIISEERKRRKKV